MNWQALALSLKLAVTVSAVLLVVSLPLSYGLAYWRWRWRFLVEAVVALPLVLPPTVLGFYVLVALGSRSPLGRWYESWTGRGLTFTFAGLVIGSVLYSLPFAVQPVVAAFRSIEPELVEVASVLGATRTRTFFQVILPLSAGGVLTGVVLSFAHTLGEFGVVLMVGGNIPGVTRTISIDIYDDVQALDFAGANHTALALLFFSFVVLALLYGVNRKAWTAWPSK